MAQVLITRVDLKGPAGNSTVSKRVSVTRVNLHGPIDKRVRVSKVTLVAPPPDAKVQVSRVKLVGANSALRPVYYGSPTGWVPIDLYIGTNGVWTKVI